MPEPEAAGAVDVAPSLLALGEWLAEKGGPAWALEVALEDSERHPREFRVGWERGYAAANARAERLAAALAIYADPSNWDYCENECEWTFDGPSKEVWTGTRGPNSYARAALAEDAPEDGRPHAAVPT